MRAYKWFLIFAAIVASQGRSTEAWAASKQVTIRTVESTDDFKLVVFGRVQESENGVSFPVTTIDRNAFALGLGKSFKLNLKPDSLTTFGGASQPRARRMIVAMPFASDISQVALRDFQQTLAENLPETRSEFFSVLSVTSTGEVIIAGSVPGESDNLRALQRKVLEAAPSGNSVGVHQLVCAAQKQFTDWSRYASQPGGQSVLIILAHPSVATRSHLKKFESCLRDLRGAGVATYFMRAERFPELPVSVEPVLQNTELFGGGYSQRVVAKVDLYPALANVLANLNEEYVLTFDLFPLVGTFDGRRAISEDGMSYFSLAATYHGQLYQSGLLAAPVPPGWQENIEQVNQSQSFRRKLQRLYFELAPTERLAVGVLFIVLILSLVFITRHFILVGRLHLKTQRCKTCGLRVKRSFSNCPYRAGTHIGWLSVLSGPGVGMVLPVAEGKNFIGTSNVCSILLVGAKKVHKKHAEIAVENGKAQIKLLHAVHHSKASDAVNGFPLVEPRLLSNGDVVRIGNVFLRFETRLQ